MPRTARSVEPGLVYHVLNRGNGRMRLFHTDADYAAFLRVLTQGLARHPDVDLLAYCLMPDHWHLVLRPRTAGALGRLMGWVGVTHVRRHHERYRTRGGGHLYQGRYKSFPVQADDHFLTLCRYVEANALRAGLVSSAADWPWSSAHARRHPAAAEVPLAAWPVDRPPHWSRLLAHAVPAGQLHDLRTSVARGRPLGEANWVAKTARRLGLTSTLRGPGRPPKKQAP